MNPEIQKNGEAERPASNVIGYGDAAQLRRGQAGEVALKTAHRGAGGGNDDEGIGHDCSFQFKVSRAAW